MARCLHQQQRPGQQGGAKSLAPLGGDLPRVHPVVVVAAAAAAAVGGRLQQVVGVPHGVEAQVLGHHRQRGDGAAMHHLVRGVQEAVVVAGGRAVQHETPPLQAGVAQIRRHKVAGTCDGYCLPASEAVPRFMISA
jgi:hypothetical protein